MDYSAYPTHGSLKKFLSEYMPERDNKITLSGPEFPVFLPVSREY
jgi:hypothetical protein